MPHAIATIASYTLLEALRNRLAWVLLVLLLAVFGIAGFLSEVALTESSHVQLALLAAMLRLCAVGILITFVVTSMIRETSDKGQQLLLALPLTRLDYVLGKLAGFIILGLFPALLFGAIAMLFAPAPHAAIWAASLLCELAIVAAFSLLCVLSLPHVLPALAASLSFYVLARSIGSLQRIGEAQQGTQTFVQQTLSAGIDGLAALLPHFDTFTRTEWLVYHTASLSQLLPILLQSAIYVALLAAASLFDFYRKSI